MRDFYDVPGINNIKISRDGRIARLHNKSCEWHEPKQSVNAQGYLVVHHNRTIFGVHRLLALAFLPNPENLPIVRHLDGSRVNNQLNNLAWGTYQDNTNDGKKHGTLGFAMSRLTENDVLEMVQLYKQKWTIYEIGERFGIHGSYVGIILKGDALKEVERETFDVGYPRGSRHGNAVLSEEDVIEIKRLLKITNLSCREIGKKFGVTQSAISRIKSGKRWAWLFE